MQRCYWELNNIEDSTLFALCCDFSQAPFPTHRKMQLLYGAASELACLFSGHGINCFIGIGPSNDDYRDHQWQLVLIPDDANEKRNSLVTVVYEFHLLLNKTPRHYLLDPHRPSSKYPPSN